MLAERDFSASVLSSGPVGDAVARTRARARANTWRWDRFESVPNVVSS